MTTLYHCTPAAMLAAILDRGLDPEVSQSSLKAVYLTDDEYTAANYACMREGEHVMLAVELEALDESLLGPDNYELPDMLEQTGEEELRRLGYHAAVTWDEVSWRGSLKIANQVAYYGAIPAATLRVVESKWLADGASSGLQPPN